MKNINIGDRVEVIDDVIFGKVISVDAFGNYVVLTDDGVQLVFSEKELVKISSQVGFSIKISDLQKVILQENSKNKRKLKKVKKIKYPIFEVDLHIEKLVKNPSQLSQFDMLEIQLNTAKQKLDYALKQNIKRIVFIHGVGKGVLKAELEFLFSGYSNIEFFDAPYHLYGMGAMEISVIGK